MFRVQTSGSGLEISVLRDAETEGLMMQEEETTVTGVRELSRWHSGSCISEGQAAVELFFRLNHARQTVDYVRRQVSFSLPIDVLVCSLHRELQEGSPGALGSALLSQPGLACRLLGQRWEETLMTSDT